MSIRSGPQTRVPPRQISMMVSGGDEQQTEWHEAPGDGVLSHRRPLEFQFADDAAVR